MKKMVLSVVILVLFGLAKTAVPPTGGRPFEIKVHNINQVEMCVSNYGKFGQTAATNAGLWWPRGSGHNYIFGAGPWFGTIDSIAPDDMDTLVTIGYGPHGAETEFTPGKKDMSSGDPNAVIFMYPEKWPPPADVFPMAPQEIKSHQDSWCVYNDLDINQHVAGDTRPIGLEVYQTVYAWNLSTTQDIIFIRYELKNVSGKTLKHCYFGVCTDNDIGNEASPNQNDIISGIVWQEFLIEGKLDTVDNVGYQWQTEREGGWDEFPGAIGFDYLQSPWDLKPGQDKDQDGIPDEHERDSAYYYPLQDKWDVDGDGTPDWRDPSEIPQIGMTAFKRFTLNLEPNKDNERYLTLAGYNFKTGLYEPYDTLPPSPDDQRFLQCSGPFELPPESIAIITVGIMLTYWDTTDARPDTAIAKIDQQTQYIYDMNWLLPGPPPPPMLTCVPGDKKVTLVWDKSSEITPDPYYKVVHFADPTSPVYDPYYLEYDFEGYRVWKSLTGKAGSWELLASFDLANQITFEDTAQAESIRLIANDAGIVHSFVDEDVRNGFQYYYAVTAFDYNYVKTVVGNDTFPRPIWFESGQVPVAAAPRRDPANLVPGSVTESVISGNARLSDYVAAEIVYPLKTEDDSCYVQFAEPEIDSLFEKDTLGNLVKRYRAGYTCYLLDNAQAYVDTNRSLLPFGDTATNGFGEYKGAAIQLKIIAPDFPTAQVSIFDSIIVTGSYPDSVVAPQEMDNTAFVGIWAYRGNDYTIIWKAQDGVVKTVVVIDATTGDTIPYKRFNNADSTAHLADGWCFTSSKNINWRASDTLILTGGPAVTTKFLYICGGLIKLNKGVVPTQRPSEGDIWTAVATSKINPAPVCGLVKYLIKRAQLRTDTTFTLNVKVVPNPYLIHNEWQQSSLIRRLKFINLPGECIIRIFNLNGELVKTIVHKETFAGSTVFGDAGGDEWWDLLSENRQLVASGVYIFHIDSKVGKQVGKFVIIR